MTLSSREEARKRLNINKLGDIILVYGAISLRKGIEYLINAAMCDRFPENTLLLFAGAQDPAVQEYLMQPHIQLMRSNGKLIEINRYLSVDEETMVFSASDLVWLGYKEHYGSSALMVQAGAAGLPVLSTHNGLIGWNVMQHGNGIIVDMDNPNQLANEISSILLSLQDKSIFSVKGREFSIGRTSINFSRTICDRLLY